MAKIKVGYKVHKVKEQNGKKIIAEICQNKNLNQTNRNY